MVIPWPDRDPPTVVVKKNPPRATAKEVRQECSLEDFQVISHPIVTLPATNDNGHARVNPTDSHFVTGAAARMKRFSQSEQKTGNYRFL